MRNQKIYLADMMESIKRIESYAESGRESFFNVSSFDCRVRASSPPGLSHLA